DVEVGLRVGQHLHGEVMPRMPVLIDRFFVKGDGAESPIEGDEGADPAGTARVSASGPQWLAYQSHPFPVELDAQKFEDYLRDEGLEGIVAQRAKNGQSQA